MICILYNLEITLITIDYMPEQKPIKVLEVVGSLNRGGTETWLLHLLRCLDRRTFHLDFLVHDPQKGAYDDEILALGGGIIPCLKPHHPWSYARNFRRVLQDHGPYDIVHSHLHHYSGFVLWLARQAGIPGRIAHSHLDTSLPHSQAGPLRRLYLALMTSWIQRHATAGLAASQQAAVALFGPHWRRDPRWRVLYCGIDLSPFHRAPQRQALRAALGISPEALVIGHVGRFFAQKNHAFLVEVAQEIARREKNFILLLIGDGPLRPLIQQRVHAAGLGDRVIFLGWRNDVPRLMLGAMDVFLFPSLYEGLGLVLVEAQAAGLPCVISAVVPWEADVVPPLVERLSLSLPAATWAEAVLDAGRGTKRLSQEEALRRVEGSPFNVLSSVTKIQEFYESVCIPFGKHCIISS